MRSENLPRLSTTQTSINSPQFLTYKYLFEDLRAAINSYAKGDVLDIGCGNKPYQHFFENKTSSYVGCDVIQSDKNQVDIICAATDIPLPDNSKDTVFSTQVIEHVADHNKLLAEAYRILRPGGYLILSGPMAWEHHEEPYDFFRFTKYGFEYILQNAGFREIKITPNGGKWAGMGQLLQNSIRSSIYGKKSLGRSIVKYLYILFRIKWLINLGYLWLEKIDPDYSFTLNFVIVARKK
jgi:SAM-dependent methyltransferase